MEKYTIDLEFNLIAVSPFIADEILLALKKRHTDLTNQLRHGPDTPIEIQPKIESVNRTIYQLERLLET